MHAHRRQFLAGLSALAMAGAAGRAAATQPYQKLGVQLYTVRAAFDADPLGTLKKVKAIGYDQVEPIGFGGMTAAAFAQTLNSVDLEAPSIHIGLGDWQTRPQAALDDAAAIGADYAVLPWLPEDQRKDWKTLAAQMNAWAGWAAERDLGFAYHNHNFEFAALPNGDIPYHLLLDNTDPELVAFELDCYWCSLAGHDPVHILSEHGDRIKLLHLKDMTAKGDMAPVGEGTIDFPAVLAKAHDIGVEYVYVEHDNPADPWVSLATSFKNLKG